MKKDKKDIKKVVLAYSGGLDTSIIIPWLKENYNNCEVIAVSGDVGQGTELDGLEEKAKKTGASKLYVLDLKKEYVEDFIWPCLKADAKYEDYLLGTSHARPCIAKGLAEIAIKEGADAICHGCTGKGNDQVRFELTLKALAPDMAIIAPWREWDIKSRDEEIDYAEAHNIPLRINRETNYSKDKNLWHLSHEGLDLEDPKNEPQYNKEGFLELGVSPEQAPDTPTYVTIHFEKGIPTAVDGKEMDGVALIETLNKLGGENGIGLLDIVENRLVDEEPRRLRDPRRRDPLQSPQRAGNHHAGQGELPLQGDHRPEDGRDRLQRPVVHPAAPGHLRLHRRAAEDRHRRCDPQTLQGQHDQRRRHQPLHPLRRADRFLRGG